MLFSTSLQNKIARWPSWAVTLYAALSAFGVYCCMYAFRKPFTAASYEGLSFLSIDYKVWLVTAQVIGYMLSKFFGVRFISSMKKNKRASMILQLITVSWISLLFFAIVPSPYNIVFLLLNGFPLGMVWGIVFSYLEGRKTTEFTGAVLSVSFIFSSGLVKTAGKSILLFWGSTKFWMPFITGSLFLLPLLVFTLLLNHIPPPTAEDIALRTERLPMNKEERKKFLGYFLPGIIIIVGTYILLTILRDFRDNFVNELWKELGYQEQPSIFTKTETYVALIVLACMSLLMWIRNNIRAFIINHYIIIGGYGLLLVASYLFSNGYINPVVWMTMVGSGLYISYVPFNCLYFERMIATYKVTANVGFIMYIADAFGYLGSVAVLFVKQFAGWQTSWSHFFIWASCFVAVVGMLGTLSALLYFKRKFYVNQNHTQPIQYAV